jgi:uncharacterized protein (TIGR02145 family)
LCDGFVEGTTREHYGKSKTQFCDERDGKKYVYVQINTQVWMAENLNYNATSSKCYSNSEANCTTYGRLYNWSTAMAACPSGWHLPNDAEWTTLVNLAGTKLKATSGWNNDGNGTDDYGFAALPGGAGNSSGDFYFDGLEGNWWGARELVGSGNAYGWRMGYSYEDARYFGDGKSYLYSVRCLQN